MKHLVAPISQFVARDESTPSCALPTIALGKWPTPITHIQMRGQPRILVKRDDLCGWGRGGAKARKIRYLIGHMRARGHTDLVTLAGNITNLAFDLIPALDGAGIGAHLYIIDDPPTAGADRLRIFDGISDRVTLLGPSRWAALRATICCRQRLRAAGRRPLWVMPGVSHPAAIMGNAHGFLEMVRQLRAEGHPPPTTVFVTAATGTTLAGFVLAERLLRARGYPPIRVVGAQVYPGRVATSTRWLSRWATLVTPRRFPSDLRVEVATDALAGGFGHYTPVLAALCRHVQEEAGIMLDPIFGGKTWSVMDDYIRKAKPRDGEVLYWHCGYTPEWRALGVANQKLVSP